MLGRSVNAWGLMVLATVFALPNANLVQAQPVNEASSLKATALTLAPHDAAFFSTNLNLRKAWDEFIGGSFVSRLRELPYVEQLEGEVLAQWENPEGQVRSLKDSLKNPNVKNLLELILDMNSREFFYYGEKDWNASIGGLMGLYQDINSRSNNPIALQEFLAELDAEYLDGIRIPTTVIGFRLTNEDIARTLLDALQGVLQLGLQQIPELSPLAKQITRKDFKDGQALSVTLTTSLIPMDKLDPTVKEMLGGLLEGLEARKIVFSLGLRAKTLLIGISEDVSPILTIGEGEPLLNHERLQILREHTPSDLRSISYVSKQWRESQWNATYRSYFRDIAARFAVAVSSEESQAVDIEQWRAAIQEDAADLDERIGEFEHALDAALSWSFASDVGWEGMTYDWSESVFLENAAPMSIIRHAGTKPLLMFAFKQKSQPSLAELMKAIIDRAPEHIRRFIALAEQADDQRDQALEIMDRAWPLVEESYSIVMDEILPAVDEYEGLFCVSAQWTTPELSSDLPPPEQPLPLPEISAAIKLRNRDQFLSACKELYGVFDKIVALVREVQPDSVPEGYAVPRPQLEEMAGATRFYYEEFSQGSLAGFEPQVIVSNDTVVIGYSARHVLDLIQEKALAARPAWLAPDMPLASMSIADMAGIVRAVSPWLDFGFQIVLGDLDTPVVVSDGPVPTGRDIIQVWECFMALGRSAATTVINDEGVTVSRWVWVGE